MLNRHYDFADEHPEYELTHYRDILERNGLEWGSQSMSRADVGFHRPGGDGTSVGAEEVTPRGAPFGFFLRTGIRRWLLRLREIDNGGSRAMT